MTQENKLRQTKREKLSVSWRRGYCLTFCIASFPSVFNSARREVVVAIRAKRVRVLLVQKQCKGPFDPHLLHCPGTAGCAGDLRGSHRVTHPED